MGEINLAKLIEDLNSSDSEKRIANLELLINFMWLKNKNQQAEAIKGNRI